MGVVQNHDFEKAQKSEFFPIKILQIPESPWDRTKFTKWILEVKEHAFFRKPACFNSMERTKQLWPGQP